MSDAHWAKTQLNLDQNFRVIFRILCFSSFRSLLKFIIFKYLVSFVFKGSMRKNVQKLPTKERQLICKRESFTLLQRSKRKQKVYRVTQMLFKHLLHH